MFRRAGGRAERKNFGLWHIRAARQGAADRPQSQDRDRSADPAASRDDLSRQPDEASARCRQIDPALSMSGSDVADDDGKAAGAMLAIGEQIGRASRR